MSDRDIIDEIDALVDEQMANYGQRSGYDHNVNQAKCPQPWCTEDFHGLAITSRMAQMRRHGGLDPEYKYAEDDSAIICPGSTFAGDFTPPAVDDNRSAGLMEDIVSAQLSALLGIPDISDDIRRIATWANPLLPEHPNEVSGTGYTRRNSTRPSSVATSSSIIDIDTVRSTVHFAPAGTPLPAATNPMDLSGFQERGTIEAHDFRFTPDTTGEHAA